MEEKCDKLEVPLKLTMVGKFSCMHPQWEKLRKDLPRMGFKVHTYIHLLDNHQCSPNGAKQEVDDVKINGRFSGKPVALTHSLPDDQSPKAVKKWFKHRLPHAKQKITKLHFYLQNTVIRNSPASAPVARAKFTDSTPTNFGLVNALDGPLTRYPNSKRIIGYSQGLFTFSLQEEKSALMTLKFVFTAGKYNGSTLSILRRNAVSRQYREFPIVNDFGDFRQAHGIGTASTYSNNATYGDDILEISLVNSIPDCGCD